MSLEPFFRAKSIAVVGASRTPGHVGYVILENLVHGDYHGTVFPINPQATEILGVRCYPSVLAVKEKIELAVIAVPVDAVLAVIHDCGKKGIKHVVMVTAGFSEVGNIKLQKQLGVLLKKYKIRAIGPNCLGVLDGHSGIDTIFIPRERIRRPSSGGLAIVSQSGALGSTLLDLCSLEFIGVSTFVSYGNALDVDVPELLDYFASDTKTTAVCMYIEGLHDGRAFLDAARVITKKKPVIVLKGGMTAAGSKAALSHTASLAGSGEIYRGAFRQAGCIIAENFEEFVDLAELVAKVGVIRGKRIAVVTNSGGHAILASDAIERDGMVFAPFEKKTLTLLGKALAPVPVKNPLDLLGDATAERYRIALEMCIADGTVDIILLMCMPQTPRIDVAQLLEVMRMVKGIKSTKPLVCVTSGSTFAEQFKLEVEKMGFPCYHFPEEAVRSIAKVGGYYETRK